MYGRYKVVIVELAIISLLIGMKIFWHLLIDKQHVIRHPRTPWY